MWSVEKKFLKVKYLVYLKLNDSAVLITVIDSVQSNSEYHVFIHNTL